MDSCKDVDKWIRLDKLREKETIKTIKSLRDGTINVQHNHGTYNLELLPQLQGIASRSRYNTVTTVALMQVADSESRAIRTFEVVQSIDARIKQNEQKIGGNTCGRLFDGIFGFFLLFSFHENKPSNEEIALSLNSTTKSSYKIIK